MPTASTEKAARTQAVWAGVVLAALATLAWCFVFYRTDLADENFFAALAIGPGLVLVVGMLLIVPRRSRWFGVGLAAGAPVALVLAAVILAWLVINSQY